jgi:hypothetical protein
MHHLNFATALVSVFIRSPLHYAIEVHTPATGWTCFRMAVRNPLLWSSFAASVKQCRHPALQQWQLLVIRKTIGDTAGFLM